MAIPDETLHELQAALEGNEEARGVLLERLRPRLVLWAAARMPDALRARLDPEDAAQEILLTLHRKLEKFEGGNFHAWLFTVANNRLRDLIEHSAALKRRTPEPQSFSQTSPSSAAIRAESAVRLRSALGRLAADYREVIRLRRFEELETAAVAQAMGRSPNAVRLLYFRALKALKLELEK